MLFDMIIHYLAAPGNAATENAEQNQRNTRGNNSRWRNLK